MRVKLGVDTVAWGLRNLIWYTTPLGPSDYRGFRQRAHQILRRRKLQSHTEVEALVRRYERPIFGEVCVWDLFLRLREVRDPTDTRFGNVDQLTHTLQVLDSMDDAGIEDEDMRLAALLHDLGKLLVLVNEAPENVFGMKSPIGRHPPGIGLDAVTFQWNHDDFVYDRFKDHVSESAAWLLRYHSIMIPESAPYMNARDHKYTERYLREFQVHDQGSKSMYRSTRKDAEHYREWIDARFPDPIAF